MTTAATPPESTTSPSIGTLLADVTKDISELMHQELELAKAEAKQSATKAGTGVGMFGGAAVAGHFVLLFLSIALWWGLGEHTGFGWSAVIVAVLWAIIAGVLALLGKQNLAKIKGLPQTTDSVKKIPDALKGNEENNR
jgi:hypothetical protein